MSYSFTRINKDNDQFFSCFYKGEIPYGQEEFLTVGAVNEAGLACGLIICRIRQDILAEIQWIYIAKAERNKGCGTELARHIISLFDKSDVQKVYGLLYEDKNGKCDEALKRVFDKLNASSTYVTEHLVSLPVDLIDERTKSAQSYLSDCAGLDEVSEKLLKEYIDTIDSDNKGKIKRIMETLEKPFVDAFDYASNVYCVGEVIEGILLFLPREDEKGVVLIYMAAKKAEQYAYMLNYAAYQARLSYGKDAMMTFAPLNGFGLKMGQYFKEEDGWLKIVERGIDI